MEKEFKAAVTVIETKAADMEIVAKAATTDQPATTVTIEVDHLTPIEIITRQKGLE